MSKITALFNQQFPQAVLFDLDGTLADSVPDLCTAVNSVLSELGYGSVSEDKVRCWVGDGARSLVKRALFEALVTEKNNENVNRSQSEWEVLSERLLDSAMPIFFNSYDRCCTNKTCLYEGVTSVLADLVDHGSQLACVTNKPGRFTDKLLRHLGIAPYFQLTVSGDSLKEKKPHPLPIYHAMQRLQVAADQCLMVGDSRNDILAAQAAGVKVLCLSYGYHQGEDLSLLQADAYADHFAELCAVPD